MNALREAFDSERAWLRACDDQRAVLDRMAAYRDDLATARRLGNGDAYALAERLVELAEDRLTVLKVEAHRKRQQRAEASAEPRPNGAQRPTPVEAPARPVGAPVRADEGEAVRRLQSELAASREALQRASRERDEAERRARAVSEEREAAVAPRGVASPPSQVATGTGAARGATPAPARVAVSATVVPSVRRHTVEAANEAQRAPVNVPTPVPATPDRADTPALTGADLAAFRRRERLTQVAAAHRLGVTQGTISKAEGNPRAVLGPTLSDALRRACG
jgi:hypothetical protein